MDAVGMVVEEVLAGAGDAFMDGKPTVILVAASRGWGRTRAVTAVAIAARERWPGCWLIRAGGSEGPPAPIAGFSSKVSAACLGDAVSGLRDRDSERVPAVAAAMWDTLAGSPAAIVTSALTILSAHMVAGLVLPVGVAALRMAQGPDVAWARAAARMGLTVGCQSKQQPTLVVVDDADAFDQAVLASFVRAACAVFDARIAVVVNCVPNGDAVETLEALREGGVRVERLDVPGRAMLTADRRVLIHDLEPRWPSEAVDALAERTSTFTEVRSVLSHDSAADIPSSSDPVAAVGRLVAAAVLPRIPSHAERLISWAGGVLHQAQLDAAFDAWPEKLSDHADAQNRLGVDCRGVRCQLANRSRGVPGDVAAA